jgi:hypothetical protein
MRSNVPYMEGIGVPRSEMSVLYPERIMSSMSGIGVCVFDQECEIFFLMKYVYPLLPNYGVWVKNVCSLIKRELSDCDHLLETV